ncbi:hypothetical protein EA215_24625 [Escherichia coli]|nr:hypothetical protein EA215_24625 [Escherichia coli]
MSCPSCSATDGVVRNGKRASAGCFTRMTGSGRRLLRTYWGLTLSGTKTHVKQRFLPLTPLLMVSDVLWSPVLPA